MAAQTSLDDLIRAGIGDRSLRFVFPSAVAADAWARRAVETGMARAVDRERFIAWDRFKAETLSADRTDRRAANGAARSIFCAEFLERNAEAAAAGKPLLAELIAPSFAADWGAFVSSLSRTLPALDGFFRRLERSGARADGEAHLRDLLLLRRRYAEFLDRHRLFEPAWDRTPFRPGASRWILVFPELAEDWDEYEAELRADTAVRAFAVEEAAPPFPVPAGVGEAYASCGGKLLRFSTAVEETRFAARFAEALVDEAGLAPSDIAISVPNIADYEERLALEFRLRDLPLDLRKGRPLPEHPAGRLFAALSACRSTRWSFRALKDLLLDGAYPWKRKRDIDSLMDFGLRFRCVSGFPENGVEVDVWERSFDRLRDRADELRVNVRGLSEFYRKLKRDVLAVVRARSFEDLRTKLLEFKSNQFDESAMDAASDKVFSRAVEELADLAETEKRLGGPRLADPYGLFLTHLKNVNYVFQSDEPGVVVYDYRVAAGIAPAVHLVLNATQSAASVRADPAPFLREDRKLRAGIAERDLSAGFLRAYGVSGALVAYAASDRGFSGYAVPHRVLAEEGFAFPGDPETLLAGRPDPYEAELAAPMSAAAASFGAGSGASTAEAASRAAATTTQARGRAAARALARGEDESEAPLDAREAPFRDDALKQAIAERLCGRGEDFRVSPTDLNEQATCPFSWLLRRGLGVREKETEIETVDARELGILYHRILERLFLRIGEADPRFRAERLPVYQGFLAEEIDAALAELRSEEGAFQESVYDMYRVRISAALGHYLSEAAAALDARAFVGAELPLRRAYPEVGITLSGKADLAFRADSGELSVYDFKTGDPPSGSALVPDETGALGDYQMGAYVRMLEAGREDRVSEAAFYSIENRAFRAVISAGGKTGRSGVPVPRAGYENALRAVDEAVAAVAATVDEAFYPVAPPVLRGRSCPRCRVAAVCRIRYSGDSDVRR